jgi:tetratricopeptide (TPR) repeat protein
LLLADIADTEQDSVSKEQFLVSFDKRVANYLYGNMYNKYLFNLHAEEWQNKTIALEIAQKEVELRPTSEAFSWLAWAYLINNQKEKALETVKFHVEKKSYEPESLYLLGKIYFATGNTAKAKHYLTLAKESAFELGPNIANKINHHLTEL